MRGQREGERKNVPISRVWERTRAILGVEEPNRATPRRLLSILGHRYTSRPAVRLRDPYKCDGDGCAMVREAQPPPPPPLPSPRRLHRLSSTSNMLSRNTNLRCNNSLYLAGWWRLCLASSITKALLEAAYRIYGWNFRNVHASI